MTPRETQRKDDETSVAKPAAPKDPPAKLPDPKKPTPYTFKFAPADPKNSFDFEDTADK